MNTNPAGASAIISSAVKGVLLALVAIKVLPWDGEQVGAVALALSGVVDALLYLRVVRPKLQEQAEEQAIVNKIDISAAVDQGVARAIQATKPS